MANRYELAYIYARVCGSLERTWNAQRIGELVRNGKLADAWRAVFNEAPPALPEGVLVDEAERRAIRKTLGEYNNLVGHLQGEEPFFEALRRKSEFARVKRVILALRRQEASCPESDDPGLAPSFAPEAYPDVGKMFSGGRYGWINKESLAALAETDNRLDRQYYEELWSALSLVKPSRRGGVPSLILLDIELSNMAVQNIAPTKSNLLREKERLSLALEGYDLLDRKREILVMTERMKENTHMRGIAYDLMTMFGDDDEMFDWVKHS